MKKVVKKPTAEKYVTEKTFEKAMVSIAKSFQKIDDRFEKIDKNFDATIKVLSSIQEDNREYKKRALENDITMVSHDKKINDLIIRVEKLEAKVK